MQTTVQTTVQTTKGPMIVRNRFLYILDVFLEQTPLGKICQFLIFVPLLTVVCSVPMLMISYIMCNWYEPFLSEPDYGTCFLMFMQFVLGVYGFVSTSILWYRCITRYFKREKLSWVELILDCNKQLEYRVYLGLFTITFNPFSIPLIQLLTLVFCGVNFVLVGTTLVMSYDQLYASNTEDKLVSDSTRITTIVIMIEVAFYIMIVWIKSSIIHFYSMIMESIRTVCAEWKNYKGCTD